MKDYILGLAHYFYDHLKIQVKKSNCFSQALNVGLLSSKSHDEDACGFWLKVFSASLSIVVGVAWLVLVFTGTMDVVFGE